MQMVLSPDAWLAGKIIVLLNDSDVNKISHSFEKKKKKKKTPQSRRNRGKKSPARINLSLRKRYSAVQMNDLHSNNISVTMLHFPEQKLLCVCARCKHADTYIEYIQYILNVQYMPCTC